MGERHLIIIGGGLAGLSAGCYARRSGLRTTIVEHNAGLGGVCTAWQRGQYLVDGCIHWLTGGPFQHLYEELDIVPAVPLRTLETWNTYRDARDGFEVPFTRNLDALVARLGELGPQDHAELGRLRHGAAAFAGMKPPFDPPELTSAIDKLRALWDMRGAVTSLLHFRKPIGTWAREHLESPRLRRIFTRMLPETAPASFLLMVLAYLEHGYLSRPVGGTAAFRDALEKSYRALGGEVLLRSTVDEILVDGGRATGVRLSDGTMLAGELVLSTSSAPETVLHLLGGRYNAEPTRERMARWKMFDPIVLVSFGVEAPYASAPSLLTIDNIKPLSVGGRSTDTLGVRVCNDDPCFAPPGHSVVQALLPTDYQWWATLGSRYPAEKDALAAATIAALEPHFPNLGAAVRMTDLVTPLTYWSMTRAWRGAFEGWMPNADSMFNHVKKTLTGLGGFYMAGQWVEPGGGVPTSILSGRQVVQLMCDDVGQPFAPTGKT